MQSLVGILVVAAVVVLLARRAEVRLVLLGGGFVLACLGGQPLLIFDVFARAMVAGLVAPICAAMGFAAVMTHTGCDRHLVELLARPLRRAGAAVAAGGILVAYLVNVAVPSQTSTAAAVGPILVPLMQASGLSPVQSGAALVLGASFGGDLLNPAAQDPMAIAGTTELSAPLIYARVWPASLVGLLVAAAVFQWQVRKSLATPRALESHGQVHLGKALVPLLPLTLLLLAYAGFTPLGWLLEAPQGEAWEAVASGLPVVRAMLLGVLAIGLLCREPNVVREFFEGMGRAYASIISLTIVAQCFGAGLAAVGLADLILAAVSGHAWLTVSMAILFPLALALLSGSGSGPILTFAQTLLVKLGPGHERLAAMACLSGAYGRTASPVSAVVIYCAGLVNVDPRELVGWVYQPLLAGAVVSFLVAL